VLSYSILFASYSPGDLFLYGYYLLVWTVVLYIFRFRAHRSRLSEAGYREAASEGKHEEALWRTSSARLAQVHRVGAPVAAG
jgi:hypothetical protein